MSARARLVAALTGARARRVAGGAALLAALGWGAFAWMRHRAMSLPPTPPAAAPRTTVLARDVQPGSEVLVDGTKVWFVRGTGDSASLASVPGAGGAERTVVEGEHDLHLAGSDEGFVYFRAKRPFRLVPSVPAEEVDQLLRVPKTGGAPQPVPGECGKTGMRIAWADPTGIYCVTFRTTVQTLRTDSKTGATLWTVASGGGERWSHAYGSDRVYVSFFTAHLGSCGGPLLSVALRNGQLEELMGIDCPAPLAADATGLYVATGHFDGDELRSPPVIRFPPSWFAEPVTLTRARVDALAVTTYHVVWSDADTHAVHSLPKTGGSDAVVASGAVGALASDGSAVYFAGAGGELVRVDGID